MRTWITLALAPLLAAGLALGACGDDDDAEDVIDSGRETIEAFPTEVDERIDGEDATPQAGGSEGQRLEIAAENSVEYTRNTLAASPGEVTVVFSNEEDGVIHNIHFFDGDSADAPDLASTELEAGPSEQEVAFTVEEGEYFYHCDAHLEMQGTLTVE